MHEQAWATLAATAGRAQRQLLALLDVVKSEPLRRGDFQQRDANGRTNEVLLAGDWLVTFWSDHAVCEVHVVNLEHVED